MSWSSMVSNIKAELKEKASKVEKTEDAAAVIWEFEEIIKSKKRNIIWLAYQQGRVFEKFKENANFVEIVKELGVTKSTSIFKLKLWSW